MHPRCRIGPRPLVLPLLALLSIPIPSTSALGTSVIRWRFDEIITRSLTTTTRITKWRHRCSGKFSVIANTSNSNSNCNSNSISNSNSNIGILMGTASSSPSSLERDAPSSSSSSIGNGGVVVASSSSSHRRHRYAPPSTPVSPMVHYIFLIHGYMGNEYEQDYLSGELCRRATGGVDGDDDVPAAKRARRPDGDDGDVDDAIAAIKGNANVVVYSPKCNVGRTHDGIRAGGTRLANEIIEYVKMDVRDRLLLRPLKDDEDEGGDDRYGTDGDDDATMRMTGGIHVTYSIVGNSLGGLYGRYAISLLPYRLPLSMDDGTKRDRRHRHRHPTTANDEPMGTPISIADSSHSRMVHLHLHPNVFCTTATPHLGVSRHTYLPLPRIVETIIGTGMRTTGRDLFRLRSKSSMSNNGGNGDDDDEGMECVIRNMCLKDSYLDPLRSFRHRIAYANAYGTDFQVPTTTAAFLNDRSVVAHRVVANRGVDAPGDVVGGGGRGGTNEDDDGRRGGEGGGSSTVPSFIVAVCRTEERHSSSSLGGTDSCCGGDILDDDLLLMSQSLDSLGWTKVFIDVRDYLPVTGMSAPSWLRSSSGTLDDIIRERTRMNLRSPVMSDDIEGVDDVGDGGGRGSDATTDTCAGCIITSQELARSTHVSDSMDLPLGHAVMVANSKNERYSQLNSAGRPVMDKLAKDIIDDILKFE